MLIDILKYIYRRPQHLVIQALSRLWAHPLNVGEMHNVLVISPHPDDEVLGCGNLIQKLCKCGVHVELLILSKGEGIAKTCELSVEEIVMARQKLARQANRLLGLHDTNISYLDFPDGMFASVDKSEIEKLAEIIRAINPDTIFYPHPYDGSPDHIIASDIITCLTEHLSCSKYHYCVWLWHHMPFYKAFILNYRKSFLLQAQGLEKSEAVSIYAQTMSANGNYYSGKLPKMLLKAIEWKQELYFKV